MSWSDDLPWARSRSRRSNLTSIRLRFNSMTRRHNMRALVAAAAAYALALQAILLAFGASIGTQGGGLGGPPICSGLATAVDPAVGSGRSAPDPAPLGHLGGCPGPCLGCCCCPLACRIPAPIATYAPAPAPIVSVAFAAMPPFPAGVPAAHRSRAPPLA
jgi:hypothetical protein